MACFDLQWSYFGVAYSTTLHLQSLWSQHLPSFLCITSCKFSSVFCSHCFSFRRWYSIVLINTRVFMCVCILCWTVRADEINSFYSSHLWTLLSSGCIRPSFSQLSLISGTACLLCFVWSIKLYSFSLASNFLFFFSPFIGTYSNTFRLCPRMWGIFEKIY